jgi:hypothetical protein
VPAGFPTGNSASLPINADVNGDGGDPNGGFYLLSAVNNGWQMTIDKEDTANNDDLNFSEITDIVVHIQVVSNGTQALVDVMKEIEAIEAQGKTVSLALQAEYEALLAEPYVAPAMTEETKSLVAEMVTAMKSSTITPTTYVDPLVVHGQYNGMMLAMGFAELGVIITATDVTSASQPIIGTLCVSCTVLHTASTPLTGQFVNTGTPTNTFSLASAPVVLTVDGQVLTKTYLFDGLVLDRGNVISGTYQEVVTNSLGVASTTYVGFFNLSRWTRYPGAVTPTVGITTMGNDVELSWATNIANCNYSVYRSSMPYFVQYDRNSVESGAILAHTDTAVLNSAVPNRYYRVRGFSCNTTLDFLEPNATFFEDSTTKGVFSFDIVAGTP